MKAALRKELRGKRRAMLPHEHAARSRRAASAIARLRFFKAGARIAVYLPFDAETDPSPLLRLAARRGIRLYVPVVDDLRHRRLRFQRLTRRTRPGAYGISIPHAAPGRLEVLAPRWFDLVVVPLVGIDSRGKRLGMGAGFYDRAFGFRQLRTRWRGPFLVALCFDCQRTSSIHADPWDLTLDAVASESGVREFPTSTSDGGAP